MKEPLRRLLNPKSIGLLGGHWADAIVAANRTLGYQGEVWHVHPEREGCYRSIADLPGSPDVAFVAVLSKHVPAIARELRARNTGGFICFASDFEEAENLALTGTRRRTAAGTPFLGTNCYGFINYFDGVALWPDNVDNHRPSSGVAIISQSGGVGIGFTHSQRSLPIGYLISVGNQTDISIEQLIEVLTADERVTAFGLYVEGIKDWGRFQRAVALARAAGKPVALIKAGRTESSVETARLHTASVTGNDAEFDGLCRRIGVARCDTLATLIETLKVFHMGGPLRGRRVLAMAASAGYTILTADAARHVDLDFAPMPRETRARLGKLLGPRIVLSNPFDFQTLYWHDRATMRAMFMALFDADYDAIAFMFGYPPLPGADTSQYDMPINEYLEVSQRYATRAAVLAPLPEFLSVELRNRCVASGVVPLQGHLDGLQALSLAALG